MSAGSPMRGPRKLRPPVPGEAVLSTEDGAIVQYSHGEGVGTVVVGSRRLRFRGGNASADVTFQIGERVRCCVLRSGFVQRLERQS